jgi:hypothetical protein
MDPNPILDRMDQVLADEREAIRRLDGAGVEAAAAEKTALVESLTTLSPAERKTFAPRLRALVAQLRRNGVLLVHAKGILTEVLRARGADMGSPTQRFARGPALGAGNRLSVRG